MIMVFAVGNADGSEFIVPFSAIAEWRHEYIIFCDLCSPVLDKIGNDIASILNKFQSGK